MQLNTGLYRYSVLVEPNIFFYRNYSMFFNLFYKIMKKYKKLIYNVLQKEVSNVSFSIRLNKDEEKLFKSYAKLHGCSLSEALKSALLEKIEDEYDIALAEQANLEYLKDPQTISHEELIKELGL